MLGKCDVCGKILRTHRSRNKSANVNMLRLVQRHYKKSHPTAMSLRIKAGLKRSKTNPILQNFTKSLSESASAGARVIDSYTKHQYLYTREVMENIKTILPPEVQISWEIVKYIGDKKYSL